MNQESIFLYKHLSKLEYSLGIISIHEYYLRLITLYDLSGRSNEIIREIPAKFFERNFQQNIYPEYSEFNNYHIEAGEGIDIAQLKNDKDPVMYFLSKPGNFTDWLFRVGDPDFFPSIPHGHGVNNSKIKLDCYLGYFYDVRIVDPKKKNVGRETRQYIIDLWNNDKFRTLAINCIDWYLDRFPKFRWRVPTKRERVLPKKR